MSKLGLGRAKLASSVSSAFGQGPPDKKRKTDDNVHMDSAFDDDLDILLTQNMNKIDNLVASTQSAESSACNQSATNCYDSSHHNSTDTADLVSECAAKEMCCDTGRKNILSTGKRLIGHGSSHSRSVDYLNSSSSGSSKQLVRKGSFSTGKSWPADKQSDKVPDSASFQAKGTVDPSTTSAGIVNKLHTTDSLTTNTLPMRLDANANLAEMKLTQVIDEREYYKAEVCLLLRYLLLAL